MNNNDCLISQLEEKIFGENFLGPGKKITFHLKIELFYMLIF